MLTLGDEGVSHVQAVKNIWNRVIEQHKAYKHLAKVHIELVQRMEKFDPVLPHKTIDEERAARKFKQGIPFLEGQEDDLDLHYAILLCKELCQWSGLGKAKSSFKKLLKLPDKNIEHLLRGWLKGDETVMNQIASQYQIPLDVLHVFVRYSLLPTLHQYAKLFYEQRFFQHEEWLKEYCPVCGDQHGLAEFRGDEGFRHFRCLSCAADWVYWRLGCPYCQNRDHEQLFSLFIDDPQNKYQIDVCQKCNGYVKGLYKLDQSTVPILLLDDFLTLHLDVLAEEKGYHRQQHMAQVH